MLTEPLTLPPRRWQQLALAAVVGVVFAVPYNFGFIANSPELALLVGNVLAFAAGQRGGVRLRFIGRRPLTPTTTDSLPSRAPGTLHGRTVYGAAPSAGTPVRTARATEGNPARVQPDQRARRTPADVRGGHGGTGVSSQKLAAGPGPGRQAEATSVAATSCCPGIRPRLCCSSPPESASPLTWPICATAGAAPTPRTDVVLLYLARNAAELAYAEELQRSGARILVRLADGSVPPAFMEDAGAGRIDAAALKKLVPDIASREVYISGSPASVRSLGAAARGAGARRVHEDSFTGY